MQHKLDDDALPAPRTGFEATTRDPPRWCSLSSPAREERFFYSFQNLCSASSLLHFSTPHPVPPPAPSSTSAPA